MVLRSFFLKKLSFLSNLFARNEPKFKIVCQSWQQVMPVLALEMARECFQAKRLFSIIKVAEYAIFSQFCLVI